MSRRLTPRNSPHYLPGWAVSVVPVAVAALLTLPMLSRSPLWADEIDSVSAANRRLQQLGLLLRHQDGPLAAYYVLLHGWIWAFGSSAWVVRLPSALALLAAIALIAETGRRLAGRWTGLLGGLLLAVNPFVLGFGLDARPYAFAVLASAGCALVLVNAGLQPRRGARVAYAAWLVLGGLAHLFFLLLVPAHLLAIRLRRWPVRPWLAPAALGVTLLCPLLALSAGQTFEVGYLRRPGLDSLPGWWQAMSGGEPWLAVPAALLAIVGVRQRWAQLHPILMTWLLLPGPVLLVVSFLQPLYLNRYVVESAPALALWMATVLVGACASVRLGRTALTTGAIFLASSLMTSLVTQLAPFRYEDPRAASDEVLDHAGRGDGLVMLPTGVRTVMSYYLRRVDPHSAQPVDLLQAPPGNEDAHGDFGGVMLVPAAAEAALLRYRVVWLVRYADPSADRGTTAAAVEADLARCFQGGSTQHFGLLEVRRETATGRCPPEGDGVRASRGDQIAPVRLR